MKKTPTKIVRMVAVYCPDRFGIHKNSPDGIYVRYALLFDAERCVGWIDDPSEFDLHGLIHDSSISAQWVEGDCPWCKARSASS